MSSNIPVELDRFGMAIEDICREVEEICKGTARKAVRTACKEARETVKENAHAGRTAWSEEYREGFKYTVRGKGFDVTGVVGNKSKKVGLVHLLEKGHEIIGGGRTKAYPHMGPGFDAGAEAFDDVIRSMTL